MCNYKFKPGAEVCSLIFLVHVKLSRAVNMSGIEQRSHLFIEVIFPALESALGPICASPLVLNCA